MRTFREKTSGNYQLKLRPNRDVENVFRAYESSLETERLESERGRQIYCELIDLGRKENLEQISENVDNKPSQITADKPVDDDDDEEEERAVGINEKPKWWTKLSVEANPPKYLGEIAIEKIAESFEKGTIDGRIVCQDAVDFGMNCDVELPILSLMELENETFWKRLVQLKINDGLKFQQLLRDQTTNWKRMGLELKFEEVIENLEQTDFDSPVTLEYLYQLMDKLQPIVEHLSIREMKPRKTYDKNPLNPNDRVVNVAAAECHHGSLEFLGVLTKLKSLFIKFDPGLLKLRYERRFFQVSVDDIKNVGKALTKLKKLEQFVIRRSDLSEPAKLHHLLEPMSWMPHLKCLDFSYCGITSGESGECFKKVLTINRTLTHIELKGNNLDLEFCNRFAVGMITFEGFLDYLGLSMNPILDNGLGLILRSINERSNVRKLDISNCGQTTHETSDGCMQELLRLIERQGVIREFNVNGNVNEKFKQEFIKALEKNYEIDDAQCDNCGFTTKEMVEIKVLLLRNKYYKDNPMLKKEEFSVEDEVEIEKHLKRTKHPLLVKFKREFVPQEVTTPWTVTR